MSLHPGCIEFEGANYDLSHMSPWTTELDIQAKGNNPAMKLEVTFRFTNHCYTEGIAESDIDPVPLLLDHNGNRRRFCPIRHDRSLGLRDILKEIHKQKCLFAGRRNWLVIELIDEGGKTLHYHIYLSIKVHSERGDALAIWIESAFVEDRGRNIPKRGGRHKRISFAMLARKTLLGQPIK